MILDNLLLFTGSSNGTTGGITSGPNTDAPTASANATNTIDLGLAGLPGSAAGGGARDIGVGDDPALKLMAVVTASFTGLTSIQLTLSGAPDSGTGTPGAYTVMWTGPAVAAANAIQGAFLANVDVPRQVPGQPLPRFLRLGYVIAGTGTGGSVEAGIVLDEIRQPMGAAGALGGYPPGILINN